MGKACCFPPVQVFLVSPNYLHPSEARERNQITFSVVGVYTKNYTRSVQNIILSRLSKLKLRRSMDFDRKWNFLGPGEKVLALSDRCQLCLRPAIAKCDGDSQALAFRAFNLQHDERTLMLHNVYRTKL